jgi:cellobiose-specific phosphotransferase system component IIB
MLTIVSDGDKPINQQSQSFGYDLNVDLALAQLTKDLQLFLQETEKAYRQKTLTEAQKQNKIPVEKIDTLENLKNEIDKILDKMNRLK